MKVKVATVVAPPVIISKGCTKVGKRKMINTITIWESIVKEGYIVEASGHSHVLVPIRRVVWSMIRWWVRE